MTSRRATLRMLGAGTLIARTLAVRAQQPSKIPRVGVLWFGAKNDPTLARYGGVFRQRLSELGYVDGKTILIDERFAEGTSEQLSELARELAASKVDIIVSQAVAASTAARQATSTIPIVMVSAGNPIGAGLIASLARPGGNVTGTSNLAFGGKQVELIRELVPRAARLAVLVNPTNAGAPGYLAEVKDAAHRFNLTTVVVEVTHGGDFPNAFTSIRNARTDGLVVMVEPLIGGHRREVIDFAASARLPASYDNGNMARDGGLMAYGTLFVEHYVMAANYVDKILKGAKPADLPVEQSKRFEMIINLRTAKALGLTIPQSVLLRADEVIQ